VARAHARAAARLRVGQLGALELLRQLAAGLVDLEQPRVDALDDLGEQRCGGQRVRGARRDVGAGRRAPARARRVAQRRIDIELEPAGRGARQPLLLRPQPLDAAADRAHPLDAVAGHHRRGRHVDGAAHAGDPPGAAQRCPHAAGVGEHGDHGDQQLDVALRSGGTSTARVTTAPRACTVTWLMRLAQTTCTAPGYHAAPAAGARASSRGFRLGGDPIPVSSRAWYCTRGRWRARPSPACCAGTAGRKLEARRS